MKAVKKFLYIVAAVAFFATGCTEQIEHTPAPKVDGQQVYFDVNQKTAFAYSEENPTVEIPLYRLVTDEAFTVNFRFMGDVFEQPKAPSFAAGENATKFVVKYNPADINYGETKSFKLVLTSDTTPYGDGASELEFFVTRPEPWTELGYGTYRDDVLVSTLFGGPGGFTWPVKFLQNDNNPNLYRLYEPFSRDVFMSVFGTVPDGITLTEGGYIEFELFEKEENPGITFVEIKESLVGFQAPVNGVSADMMLFSYQQAGVFADGVATFPAGSVALTNSEGYGWLANSNGLLAFAMPGVSLIDAFISAAYAGMSVNADGSVVEAIFDFELGADVESYVFTLVEGNVQDDPSEVVAGLVDGTIEGVESSADQTRWAVELSTGYYTLVAVPYASGEAQVEDAFANYFYFAGVGAGEKPEAEIKVSMGKFADYTEMFDPSKVDAILAQYPEDYYAALYIEANPDEIKSIRAWIGDAATVDGSGLDFEFIVDNYGKDFNTVRQYLIDGGGSTLLGPYNFMSGQDAVVLLSFGTIFGDTKYFRVDHSMPYHGDLAIGNYVWSEVVEGETMSIDIALTGGYAAGEAYVHMTGFDGTAFHGVVDTTAKTITLDGYVDGVEDPIFNSPYSYYDNAQTQAYGYYVSADGTYKDGCTSVEFTIDENGALTGFNDYFMCPVFNMADGSQLGTLFAFTPKSTIEPAAAAASTNASVKSATIAKSTYEAVANVELARASKSFGARPYEGAVEYKLSENLPQQLR